VELIGHLKLSGRAIGLCALVALVTSGFLPAQPALAATLSCGDIVAEDTVLENDVLGCEGRGIGIAADGVTFDLNGHTIAGGRLEFGIFPIGRLQDVTIENGTVSGFRYGVSVNSMNRPTVRNMTLRGGHDGILTLGSVDSLIEDNLAYGNDASGIFASASTGERFDNNLLIGNAAGFSGESVSGAVLTRNSMLDNTYDGLRITNVTGLRFDRNRSSGNGGFGFGVDGDSSDNALVRNIADANGLDGFWFGDSTTRTFLERNAADRNTDDGFDLDATEATLTRNSADRNGDFGFEAVPGLTDGGHNKARHNGNLAQCVNVAC
jgi:parallel beta-helix repeat protein